MNTGGKNGGGFNGDDDGALHDLVLRRALDHAPDNEALPDPRTRDAIRKMAHNLTPVSNPVPPSEAGGAAPWWRRLFGEGNARSRMPWNAAFATVLVATFVTVLWYREPVPDARLDGEAQVGGAAAPAPQEAAPVQPAPQATEAARDTANEELARSRADALRRPAPASSGKQAATAPDIDRKTSEAPPAPVLAAPPSAPAPAPAPEPAAVPSPPPAPAAAASKVMPAPSIAEQSAAEPRAFPRTEDRSTAAPVAAAAPPPMQRERTEIAPALSAQRNADAQPSGALRPAPAPRAAATAGAASPQGDTSPFSALDNWTSFNYVRAGQAVRHARGDIEGLAASVNTVARSATLTGSDLAAPVEARLELYSGTALLAVLEIAGDQVRWTPQQAGGRPLVGTPPASALAALRALLTRQ